MDERLKALYESEADRLSAMRDDMGDYAHLVFGCGSADSDVVLIGEAPGAKEAMSGTPFVGQGGGILNDILSGAGISREQLFVTNAVKYRPIKHKLTKSGKTSISNRTPTTKEVKAGIALLSAELNIIKPKIIVTLGNTPLKAMCMIINDGTERTVGSHHGTAEKIKISDFDTILCPLYHPASGIYNRSLVDIMAQDMKELAMIISWINVNN